jgi:RNA polymerase sigma factor (sigma-70 family)
MDDEINALLPLASAMARKFDNIPGLPFAEIEITAQEALAKAARVYEPGKGPFRPYAARAIQNALRDLYERQVRHLHHHSYELDQTKQGETTQAPAAAVQKVADPAARTAGGVAAESETNRLLQAALLELPPRLRAVAEGIRDGKTYAEIGAALGISKQAAHKMAASAMAALRENFAAKGFHGLDTVGLLKSASGSP